MKTKAKLSRIIIVGLAIMFALFTTLIVVGICGEYWSFSTDLDKENGEAAFFLDYSYHEFASVGPQ